MESLDPAAVAVSYDAASGLWTLQPAGNDKLGTFLVVFRAYNDADECVAQSTLQLGIYSNRRAEGESTTVPRASITPWP